MYSSLLAHSSGALAIHMYMQSAWSCTVLLPLKSVQSEHCNLLSAVVYHQNDRAFLLLLTVLTKASTSSM